jgi:hypothetical protein
MEYVSSSILLSQVMEVMLLTDMGQGSCIGGILKMFCC